MQPGNLTEGLPIGRVSSGLSFWTILTEKEKNESCINSHCKVDQTHRKLICVGEGSIGLTLLGEFD